MQGDLKRAQSTSATSGRRGEKGLGRIRRIRRDTRSESAFYTGWRKPRCWDKRNRRRSTHQCVTTTSARHSPISSCLERRLKITRRLDCRINSLMNPTRSDLIARRNVRQICFYNSWHRVTDARWETRYAPAFFKVTVQGAPRRKKEEEVEIDVTSRLISLCSGHVDATGRIWRLYWIVITDWIVLWLDA